MGKAVDTDNAKTYLETTLGSALDKIDAHAHTGGVGGTALGTASVTSTMLSLTTATNALTGNVTLTTQNTVYDGPSMAQGVVGKWDCQGSVTIKDNGGAAIFFVQLWDGTTVIASAVASQATAANPISVTLCGQLLTPAGNIRISVTNTTRNGGSIVFNDSGYSTDSVIFGTRIA